MSKRAIMFGSIGALVETSELQRESFNKAFAETGLDWKWDKDFYKSQLSNSGGRSRIADYAKAKGIVVDAAKIHSIKTAIFNRAMDDTSLGLRQGVPDIIKYAHECGLKIGFVTSTSRRNVDAVFKALSDKITKTDFDFIGNRDMILHSKPDPEIYYVALRNLAIAPDLAVAIEDSAPSVEAAYAAKIPCIAFPGENTVDQDFSKASLITDALHPDQIEKIFSLQ